MTRHERTITIYKTIYNTTSQEHKLHHYINIQSFSHHYTTGAIDLIQELDICDSRQQITGGYKINT